MKYKTMSFHNSAFTKEQQDEITRKMFNILLTFQNNNTSYEAIYGMGKKCNENYLIPYLKSRTDRNLNDLNVDNIKNILSIISISDSNMRKEFLTYCLNIDETYHNLIKIFCNQDQNLIHVDEIYFILTQKPEAIDYLSKTILQRIVLPSKDTKIAFLIFIKLNMCTNTQIINKIKEFDFKEQECIYLIKYFISKSPVDKNIIDELNDKLQKRQIINKE